MESDFELMEKAAKKIAARQKAAEKRATTVAAKKATKQKAAERLAAVTAQRGLAGKAATQMMGRLAGGAGLVLTGVQLDQARRTAAKAQRENNARAKRLAEDSVSKSVKPAPGESPTDAMRKNLEGRVSTGTRQRSRKAAPKPAPKPETSPTKSISKTKTTKVGKPGFNRRTVKEEDKQKSTGYRKSAAAKRKRRLGKFDAGGKMKSKGYAAGGKMKTKGYAAGGKMKTKGYKAGGKTGRGMGVALRGGGAVSKS